MAELDWQRVRELVGQALELEPAERGPFLDRVCAGDPGLRDAVERLLEREFAVDPDFLEPPSNLETPGHSPDLPESHHLGEFEILRELGRGGMGVVYLARQASLEREVAVKVFVETLTTTPAEVERFHREARAAARLSHPGIVRVLTDGQAGKTHWFAMERVPGHDLAREIKLQRARGILSEECPLLPRFGTVEYVPAIARLCAEVADALHYAHTQGLVHRDVKPGNLLLQPDGQAQLVDFGLVRDDSLGSVTRSGEVRGTPHYMSPEQARVRSARVDHRTDVYSLGVVLYELATLRRPFEGKSSADVISQIQQRDPASLRKLNPRVPRDLDLICATAMAKDVGARYADAAALAEDLRRFLRHEAVAAKPPAWSALARRFVRRRRVPLLLLVVLALGLVVGERLAAARQAQRDTTPLHARLVDETGAPLAGSAWARAIDPVTGRAGPARGLGRLPLRGVRTQPGYLRLVLQADRGDLLELTREAQAARVLEVEARARAADQGFEGMVWIRGGSLALREPNAPLNPLNGLDLEIEGFWLDAFEVSNADYRQFLQASAHPPPLHWDSIVPGEHDALPVVNVSWLDARAYAEWRGKRLPSFPEWTFAARGAENRPYPWPGATLGELRGNSSRPLTNEPNSQGLPTYLANAAPVDSHPEARTGSGVFHLFGNVQEWTESPLSQRVEQRFEPRPGFRLIAGHAWDGGTKGHTLATFGWMGIEPSYVNFKTGFRCARSAAP